MPVTYAAGDADERPWGRWRVLDVGDGHAVKRIEVEPGGRLSLQSHAHRHEHWIVASGTAQVTRDAEVTVLGPNQATHIKAGTRHRVENTGPVRLVFIEVQLGSTLDEQDIVRHKDDYGRR